MGCVSVLSDEPCWGQSALAKVSQWGQFKFQCSPTSRVGVNTPEALDAMASVLFQCSPTSRVGVNLVQPAMAARMSPVSVLSDEPCWGQSVAGVRPVRHRHVSVLSDEPCWGQSKRRAAEGSGGPSFSALRRAVLGSIRRRRYEMATPSMFQCSPTSRVGVNESEQRARALYFGRFSALRRAVLGSIAVDTLRQYHTWRFSALRRAVLGSMQSWPAEWRPLLKFQCSPTSRVGVNLPHPLFPRSSYQFQCSPTSRVGVNPEPRSEWEVEGEVSVLSDEPCWGQLSVARFLTAVLMMFQCSPTSRVGVNARILLSQCADSSFQCSPTSRVGVNAKQVDVANVLQQFQCSPTSRVGVNFAGQTLPKAEVDVSVLSDEPCWGQ